MFFSCAGNPPVPAKIEPTSSQNKDCRSCLAQLLFTASGEADLPTDDGPRPAAKLALRRRLWPAWARNVSEVPPGMGPNRAHEQTIRRHIYIYIYIKEIYLKDMGPRGLGPWAQGPRGLGPNKKTKTTNKPRHDNKDNTDNEGNIKTQ